MLRTAVLLAAATAAFGCGRSAASGTATGEGGPKAAAREAAPPVGESGTGGAPAEGTDARTQESPATAAPQGSRCATPGCEDVAPPNGQPAQPPVAPAEEPPPEPPPPVAGEPSTVPPLPPALAAHLERIAADGGLQFVLQIDVRALASADAVRGAVRSALGIVGPGTGTDLSCVADLVAGIEAVTYSFRQSPDEPDSGIALADGSFDMPAVIECVGRIDPELRAALEAPAADGFAKIEEHLGFGPVGPRTLGFGSLEMLREAKSGAVASPLLASEAFARARASAGAGPAYLAVTSGRRRDKPARGGVGLRTSPRIGVTGALVFYGIDRAGNFIDDAAASLERLRAQRDGLLGELGAVLPATARRELTTIGDALDAVIATRLVLQGPLVTLDAWLPEGTDLSRTLATLVQILPGVWAM